ncbi:winged helix-turn-helix domain-containing protein [Amycolatopsis sp.]|uniref:GntR family transcriptional regulator n=1 Tax=Amycolatopsis sp. TaxID=37632 RepID=UPI002E0C2970|nr:winged helix-turn-helix domain-containing protein [Amycolatopsis sp.]
MSWGDRSARIDRSGPDLVWKQVADDLRADIESGDLPAGSKLPNEFELAEIYGVARATMRTAILSLRSAGLITVTKGRGTYVTRSG